jgi:enoyl-CoA hydratase/carnithine racemase
MDEWVRLEVSEGIATIRLDRPPLNALNVAMQARIGAAALEVAERPDIRRSCCTAARRRSPREPTSRR